MNDKKVFNTLYRLDLIKCLKKNGYIVNCHGFFDTFLGALSFLKNLFLDKKATLVSSNLKSNLICTIFRPGPCYIILNGMGRLRKSKTFRIFLLRLFYFKSSTSLIIQNYADYRYLKLYARSNHIYWVPGSGGSKRDRADNSEAVLVQRDGKIRSVAKSISEASKLLGSNIRVNIIGCNNNQLIETLFKSPQYKNIGYVEQSDIFRDGSIFIQPEGYGEGFPHTLADAIVSGLKIVITKEDYIRFGLHKLGFGRHYLNKKWLEINVVNRAKNKICALKINKDIVNIIEESDHYSRCLKE